MLCAWHGDRIKPERMPGVMAATSPRMWGNTLHRHALGGHIHSDKVIEADGARVETFRTLAARDAYAAGHGYNAGRDMRCIVYHRLDGEIMRYRCDAARVTRGE